MCCKKWNTYTSRSKPQELNSLRWKIISFFCVKVDGEEDIKAGLDLYEFSEVLRDLGCWEAVVKK